MNATTMMNATSAITTTMTMAEATEKVSALTKCKNFVKEHKTAFAVGGTAVAGVTAGVLIGKGTDKVKTNGGLKNLLKSKKSKKDDTSDEQSA